MGNDKRFKSGDLILIRTPPFHKKSLSTELEGKSGVILNIREDVTPSSIQRFNVIFEVLIDGSILYFHNDRYFTRMKAAPRK